MQIHGRDWGEALLDCLADATKSTDLISAEIRDDTRIPRR
jgi:hypothetical protein